MYDGIINVYKPKKMTSFDVVSIMRKLTGVKKIGHTGTLDPNAEGVLTVCIGQALKCVEYMTEKDKEYVAELTFGSATDTQDSTGTVQSVSDKRVSHEVLKNIVQEFQGSQMQVPPLYSALKINGKKYCDVVRKGLDIELSPQAREIQIYSISLENVFQNEENLVERATLKIHCSKGTYIRTLCNDIAARSGTYGHMSALTRTKAGIFLLENSYSIDKLREMKETDCLKNAVEPCERAFERCKLFKFNPDNIKRITNGIPIKLYLLTFLKNDEFELGEYIRVYDEDCIFRAVGRVTEDETGLILKGYRIF